MRLVSSVMLGIALLVSLAACNKDVTGDVEKLADRACACQDAACGKAVLDDLVKLAHDQKNANGDKDKINAAAQRLGKCVVEHGVAVSDVMAAMQQMQ
jgi:hypothetical protein